MTNKVFSEKVEKELIVLQKKASTTYGIIQDKLRLQEAKNLPNEKEIIENYKTISDKFKELEKQQEIVVNLMAKEMGLR